MDYKELEEILEKEAKEDPVAAAEIVKKHVEGFVPGYGFSCSTVSWLMNRVPGKREVIYKGRRLEVEKEIGETWEITWFYYTFENKFAKRKETHYIGAIFREKEPPPPEI